MDKGVSEFRGSQIKWIINCVGFTGTPNVDACEEQKQTCWDLNVTLPTILAQFCVKENIKIRFSASLRYSVT